MEITHLKIADQSLWGRMAEIVAMIDAARARGVDVQANVYPYTRGNNDLVTILPPWAHEGGRDGDARPAQGPGRARADEARHPRRASPAGTTTTRPSAATGRGCSSSADLTPRNERFEGKTMDAILARGPRARPRRPTRSTSCSTSWSRKGGSIPTIYAHHTEADMNLALRQPWCSVGSDGSALAIEGPLRRGHPHPRNFGTFPRVLGVYVRERHLLTLEDAIRKMTSLNAAKLGLRDRGNLRPGAFADVTVFDPARVVDRSTFEDPFRVQRGDRDTSSSTAGSSLDRGKPTEERPGRALRPGR